MSAQALKLYFGNLPVYKPVTAKGFHIQPGVSYARSGGTYSPWGKGKGHCAMHGARATTSDLKNYLLIAATVRSGQD